MKKLFDLENLILALVFALPLYLVRFKLGFFSTNVWEFFAGSLFIFWLIKFWPKIKLKDIYKKYAIFILPSAAIFIGFVASSAFGGNHLHSLAVIKSWFLVPLAFLVMIEGVFKSKDVPRIYSAYYFSAVCVAAISLFYFITGRITYDGRLQAFFNSPNYLAMYLAPALIIVVIQNSKFKVLLNWILIFVILISLYFTYSYAAWFAIILSLSVTLYLVYEIKIWKLLASLILLIGLIVVFQSNNNKFSGLINASAHSSFASRLVIWKAAEKIIKDQWMFGIGPDNFQPAYLSYQKYFPPYPEWAVPHPHNVFLAFWLYGGILGVTGFLGLLYFYFRSIFARIKRAGKDPAVQKIAFLSLGIMLYILIHGLFDTTYFKNDLAVVFWLSFLALI